MQEVSLIQGSQEWLDHRKNYRNASDTPAVMGSSPYKKRNDFLKERATGISPEVDSETQRIFDDGHRFEALARPLMEEIVGEDLFPTVGVEGKFGASFDGLNMMNSINAEHKTLNDTIRACQSIDDLPIFYKQQMAHQMMVSGASKSLFLATKWLRDQETGQWYLQDKKHFWYERDLELEKQIVAAWEQFDADVATYVPEVVQQAVVAEVVKALPAVSVQVSGSVAIIDNFSLFESALRDFVDNKLIRKPQTDQDFADLGEQITALKKAEAALDEAENQMIAQVSSVESMKRTKDMLHKLARDNRLVAEKLLTAEKENRKADLVNEARHDLEEYIKTISGRVGVVVSSPVDFAAAIKGLRTIQSMQNAIGTAMANGKIKANEIAEKIDQNRKAMGDESALFPDWLHVCMKEPDDFAALLAMRVNARKEAEEKRLEAERQKIRAEEQAKAEAEARRLAQEEIARNAAKLKAEQEAAEKAEQERIAATPAPVVEQPKPEPAPVIEQVAEHSPSPVCVQESVESETQTVLTSTDETQPEAVQKPTLKLGEICARLGIVMTADFLATQGFTATVEKGAKLYQESEFPTICRKLSDHILKAAFVDHRKAA